MRLLEIVQSTATNICPRRTSTTTLSLPAFFAFVIALASNLCADTIPLGITAAAVAVDNTTGTVCSQSGVSSATCSVSGSTANAVVANGSGGLASVALGNTATGGAAITEYYFGIEGPTTESVPIIINGYANTQDSGSIYGSFSYAAYYIYQGTATGASFVADYFASPDACAYFALEHISCLSTGNFTLNTSVTSNSAFFVLFEAAAAGTNASALIDPMITIDPSFADADQFSIVANAGVFPTPNTPSVPEPFYWPAVGLLILSGAIRRRH